MSGPAYYPPAGTRVRWTAQGGGKTVTHEGVVRWVYAADARQAWCSFKVREVSREILLVVVDDDGRYYHPRPQWLKVIA